MCVLSSCERRPLTTADYTVIVNIKIEKDIVNYVMEKDPSLMRCIFYDSETGAFVTQAFLPATGGEVSLVPGRYYHVLVYNFDTESTWIENENSYEEIYASTSLIPDSFKGTLSSMEICSVMEEKIKKHFPGCAVTTDMIVAFPGETEEDFNELCEFVKEAKLDHFGAFTYSREENTPAYSFDDQIDEEVKQLRYDIIMKTQLSSTEAYLNSKIGKEVDVLCEGYDPVSESHYGRTADNAPEIDGNVFFITRKRIPEGTFVRVRIKDALEYDLTGDII